MGELQEPLVDSARDRGLFSGFEGYRSPRETDYRRVMMEGLVVLDTNVLLDLYRMNHRVRSDMLTVLEIMGDRLWVPHQVLTEFWRNQQQDSLLRHHQDRADQAKQSLTKTRETVTQALNRWASDVHLAEDAPVRRELADARHRLHLVVEEMTLLVDGQAESDRVPGAPDTFADPVITRLETLLSGRVGSPPTEAEHADAVEEARLRAERKVPPGYRDFEKGKPAETAAGDFLVWKQLMAQAGLTSSDVLFVTRDLKEDWWRTTPSGMARQPRLELVDELRALTGTQLYMVEPSNLVQQASEIFDLSHKVDTRTVGALQQLESAEPGNGEGWNKESLEALLDLLFEFAEVQAHSILTAALNDGFVSRETVYKIGNYDPSRMLRGFTRPVKTASRSLQSDGVAIGDPDELLTAVYGNGVVATGFRIPHYVVPLVRELADETYADDETADLASDRQDPSTGRDL